MRAPRSFSGSLLSPISLLLAYMLTVSLVSPFAIRRVEAAPAAAKEEKKGGRRDGELLVRFRQGVSAQDQGRLIEERGLKRARRLRGRSRIDKLTLARGQNLGALLTELRRNPAIELAEPNYLISRDEVTPNDPSFPEQWALRNTGATGGQPGADVQAVPAWSATTGAPTTVIAVIDSGVGFTHPDLQNNQWTNATETADGSDNDNNGLADDLHGWDWITDSGVVVDENGHGTVVAGVLASEGNNGAGTGDVAAAVEAIDYAAEHEARVINCSWGTEQESLALKVRAAGPV